MINCSTDFPCDCRGEGDKAIEYIYGRYYITMGHCGFNTPKNNGNGYATEATARKVISYYQKKGHQARLLQLREEFYKEQNRR